MFPGDHYDHGIDKGASPRDGVLLMATGDAPVLEALVEINAVSLARTELDDQSLDESQQAPSLP